MWVKKYRKNFSGIRKADIWRIWTDVNNWTSWHGDLDYCKLEGDFEVGNHFMLKPKGAPAVKIELVEVVPYSHFTDRTQFFGAEMFDTHAVQETPDGIRLTNTLVVKGWLKWLWIFLVAKNVAASVPQETEALVNQARGKIHA